MKFEVTFHMNSGKEIGHLVEANSEQEAQLMLTTGLERPFLPLAGDLVVISKHVEYFHLSKRED